LKQDFVIFTGRIKTAKTAHLCRNLDVCVNVLLGLETSWQNGRKTTETLKVR